MLRPGRGRASNVGHTVAQLAAKWGAKVLATASTITEALFLKSQQCVAGVIDLSDRSTNLVDSCLAATGGLGVDCVVDSGVVLGASATAGGASRAGRQVSKNDIVNVLAPGGKWVSQVPGTRPWVAWLVALLCRANSGPMTRRLCPRHHFRLTTLPTSLCPPASLQVSS